MVFVVGALASSIVCSVELSSIKFSNRWAYWLLQCFWWLHQTLLDKLLFTFSRFGIYSLQLSSSKYIAIYVVKLNIWYVFACFIFKIELFSTKNIFCSFQSSKLPTNAYFSNFMEFSARTKKILCTFMFLASHRTIFIEPHFLLSFVMNMELFQMV